MACCEEKESGFVLDKRLRLSVEGGGCASGTAYTSLL